jgi:hypothetical protein
MFSGRRTTVPQLEDTWPILQLPNPNSFHQFALAYRLRDEAGARRQFFDLRVALSGHHHDLSGWPSIPDGGRQSQPIHDAGHIDVCQDEFDLVVIEKMDRIVSVGNRNYGMTRILQPQLDVHEDKGSSSTSKIRIVSAPQSGQ